MQNVRKLSSRRYLKYTQSLSNFQLINYTHLSPYTRHQISVFDITFLIFIIKSGSRPIFLFCWEAEPPRPLQKKKKKSRWIKYKISALHSFWFFTANQGESFVLISKYRWHWCSSIVELRLIQERQKAISVCLAIVQVHCTLGHMSCLKKKSKSCFEFV